MMIAPSLLLLGPCLIKWPADLRAKYGESRLHLVTLGVCRLESLQHAAKEVGNILPIDLDHFISNASRECDHFASWEKV
jgi:hypothetical protein